jgi:tight adherence protein C
MSIPYAFLRFATIAVFSLAVMFLMYALAAAPSREANRLGMRGLKRHRALERNEAWGQLEPLVRWLGVRVSGIISEQQRTAIDKRLGLAGDWLGITPEEFVAMSLISFLGGLGFGALFGAVSGMGAIMVFIVGPVGAALPYLQVQSEAERRAKSINRGLPYAIDLLALSMSAGKDFPGAVRQVVEKSSDPDDPLIEELARILQELSIGRTRKQALLSLADRCPSETVLEFVNSVVQAEEKGNPLADVLQIQAGMSRMRRGVKAEKTAAKAGVAMIAPLMLLMLCILLLILGPMFLKLGQQSDM